jgi:hypothetical protein
MCYGVAGNVFVKCFGSDAHLVLIVIRNHSTIHSQLMASMGSLADR